MTRSISPLARAIALLSLSSSVLVACGLEEGINAGANDAISGAEFNPFCPLGGEHEAGTVASCTDRANTGACTQMDFSGSADPETGKEEFRMSCADTSDGDGQTFAEEPCEPGIASCTGATGTLESTGEQVPIEVHWYSEACGLGVDMPGTCASLGGSFSGGC